MLKKSLVTKLCTGFLCFVEKKALYGTGCHFFEAITDISSDAESHEEQNGTFCNRSDNSQVMAAFLKACSKKEE